MSIINTSFSNMATSWISTYSPSVTAKVINSSDLYYTQGFEGELLYTIDSRDLYVFNSNSWIKLNVAFNDKACQGCDFYDVTGACCLGMREINHSHSGCIEYYNSASDPNSSTTIYF